MHPHWFLEYTFHQTLVFLVRLQAHIAAATSMPMSLLSASPAHAVSEVAQLADGRASLLGLLLVPVLGWVSRGGE